MENVPCGSAGVTCTKSVRLRITEAGKTVFYFLERDNMKRAVGEGSARILGLPFKDTEIGKFCYA